MRCNRLPREGALPDHIPDLFPCGDVENAPGTMDKPGAKLNKNKSIKTKTILEGLIGLFNQYRRWFLFFGTGTSCALDMRLGMPRLTEFLETEMDGDPDWPQIQSQLNSGQTLEQALTGVGLSESTKSHIQRASGDYIGRIDEELRDDVLLGKRHWAGESLVKALVHRLPPLNPCLPIETANYDMLIEYACARLGIRYTTGFIGETIRIRNWEQARDSLNQCRSTQEGKRRAVLMSPLHRVELFKVHGSINLFTQTSVHRQIECDLWNNAVPAGLERVIAPPGDQKYEQYATIMETDAQARRAQKEAMAFAVIGYGFNDLHLHGPILDRVRSQDCPLLILTRELADNRIKELRTVADRVWILVASKSLAGDVDESHTLVYSPGLDGPTMLKNERLWACDCFAEQILGE